MSNPSRRDRLGSLLRWGRHEPKVVLARRSDGLGERLNAVLNAIRLSDLLGVEFRFTWPLDHADEESHAIAPADQFFSRAFLADHRVDHDTMAEGFVLPAGPADDLDTLRAQLASAPRGLLAPNRSLASRIDGEAVPAVLRGYSSEFARIGFHPDIEAAIEAARAAPLPAESTGIHLRAGDILDGRFRLENRFSTKVISASVARALIERSRADGSTVLVFGQDADLIAELCRSTGAIDAATLRPEAGLSRFAEAMFDMVLLSRCARIIGGSSGFAVHAAYLGDKMVDVYSKLVRPMEAVAITRADLARHGPTYHAKHRAFSWWSAYYEARKQLTADEAIELVGAALEADPTNPRYLLRLAALHYREGRADSGDDALGQALAGDLDKDRVTLESVMSLSYRTPAGQFDSREIIDDVERAAESGSAIAALYRAGLRAARGDADDAAKDVATFASHADLDGRWGPFDALRPRVLATLAEAGRPAWP